MEDKSAHGGGLGPDGESVLAFEREKLEIERERLSLERERLETERLRHRQTVEMSNGAAGRLVLPASTFMLSLLLAILAGGGLGAWIVAARFRPSPSAIAATVARAIEEQALADGIDDGTNSTARAIFRSQGRIQRGAGYLLILD